VIRLEPETTTEGRISFMSETQQSTADERLKAAQKNLREAEKALNDLRTEQRGLPAAIEKAALDGADVFELTQKFNEMPARLFAAEVDVHRAKIAVCGATFDQANEAKARAEKGISEKHESLLAEIKAAKARLAELEGQWAQLQRAHDAASRWTFSAQRDLLDAKDALQALLKSRTGQAATRSA
jgi:uncharacterized coiled-coil DUF342 family protein